MKMKKKIESNVLHAIVVKEKKANMKAYVTMRPRRSKVNPAIKRLG